MAAVTQRARITGKSLGFTVGGSEYWPDMTRARFEQGESEPVTFGDVAAGVTGGWVLKAEAIVSTDPTSFWAYVWGHVGQEVPVILAPHGNKQPTAAQPHFHATARITSRPPIGTSVGEKDGEKFEIEWPLVGEPEMKTSA